METSAKEAVPMLDANKLEALRGLQLDSSPACQKLFNSSASKMGVSENRGP